MGKKNEGVSPKCRYRIADVTSSHTSSTWGYRFVGSCFRNLEDAKRAARARSLRRRGQIEVHAMRWDISDGMIGIASRGRWSHV